MTTYRTEINRELEDIGSSLIKLRQSERPDVPQGYFEQLEKSILVQTVDNNSGKIIQWPMSKLSAIAASLMILYAAWWLISGPANETNQMIEIESTELVVEYLLDFELPDMAYLENSDISMSDIYAFDELTQEDLTAYILNNIEDFEPSLIDNLTE